MPGGSGKGGLDPKVTQRYDWENSSLFSFFFFLNRKREVHFLGEE